MSPAAVHVEGLGKRYYIGALKNQRRPWLSTFGRALAAPIRRASKILRGQVTGAAELDESIWALRDISFTVARGEVLGVVGANGAGKSTLLKILARITEPTTGQAKLYGRVASLLEVGTGFHAELTGRENVYLNGAILGMRKTEIDRKFDEIVHFSGVGKFIDTPVKHYSSGMRVRLAFSVAAELEPEILLIDEVLSVGDAEFQKKCLGKMETVTGQGRTVLFVSHNMAMLQRLCQRSILLQQGQLVYHGETDEVIRRYLGTSTTHTGIYNWTWSTAQRAAMPFVPLTMRILDHEQVITDQVSSIYPFYIELEYEITRETPLKLAVVFTIEDTEVFCMAWNRDDEIIQKPGKYVSRCTMPGNLFSPGGFGVGIQTSVAGLQEVYDNNPVLTVYIDGANSLSNLGGAILRPVFKWNSEQVNIEPQLN